MTDIPIRPSIRIRHKAIGGRLISRLTIALSLLIGIALFFLYQRFVYGLGAVTNINNGYPWGIWVVWDVVIATGFACGGYAMALLIYILNRGEFHPMIRSALTASVFGYSLGGISVLIDLGRYWNFWHILWPSYVNVGSVMFEVAACITLYVIVLWIEWFPTFLEWLGTHGMRKAFERILFVFIGLGVLLPSMHQSSLGSLLVVMGYQVHPLWQTPLLPLLFLLTALCMGYATVIFEATLAAVGFARDVRGELPLLAKLGKVVAAVLLMFMVLRFGDILDRGQTGRLTEWNLQTAMFWIETALFAFPIVAFSTCSAGRCRLSRMFPAAASMLAAAVLYRIDAYLIAYNSPTHWHYFPSAPEVLVTLGVIAIEVLAYIVFVKKFPILPGHEYR
jgi:Ni/Fe-hydrogenase subunit HybB-like protein